MTDLLTRLQDASEGSRELGDDVLLAAGWRKTLIGHFYGPMYQWSSEDGKQSFGEDRRPNPTQSIDAALTLVPEGWSGGGRLIGGPPYHIELLRVVGEGRLKFGKGATPALALCDAALQAQQSKAEVA